MNQTIETYTDHLLLKQFTPKEINCENLTNEVQQSDRLITDEYKHKIVLHPHARNLLKTKTEYCNQLMPAS
jgi:hypothetical protein